MIYNLRLSIASHGASNEWFPPFGAKLALYSRSVNPCDNAGVTYTVLWFPEGRVIPCFCKTMVVLLLLAGWSMRKISSCPSETQMKMQIRVWVSHLKWFYSFSKVFSILWGRHIGDAISHLWRKTYPTSRFLQVRCTLRFSEAIVTLWLPAGIGMDNAPFQSWRKEYPTHRFLLEVFIQCHFELMGVPWPVEGT